MTTELLVCLSFMISEHFVPSNTQFQQQEADLLGGS